MEALIDIALFILPITILVFLVRADTRASDRQFAAFGAALGRAGLPLRAGATAASWVAGGVCEGVSVTVEPFTVRSGKASLSRTAVRITDPTGFADAAIYRANDVPVDQLGALREVTFPELGAAFRCFAAAPEQVATWLRPETRATLAAMAAGIVDIKITGGTLIVVADGTLSRARAILRCVDLAVAIHHRRAPRSDLPYDLSGGRDSRWALPAYVPLLPAFILGFVLPLFPGVPSIFSAIVCGDRATLGMTWHQIGPGKYGGNLNCVDDKTHKTTEAPFLLSTLLHFNLVYLVLASGLTIHALTKRDVTDEIEAQAAARGSAPYR